MRYLIAILFLSTALFAELSTSQEETNSELIAEGGQPINLAPSLSLEEKDPIVTNIYLYTSIGGGLYLNTWPNLGTSVRVQKGVNGAEFEFSVLPPLDYEVKMGRITKIWLGYKAALSYLYHFNSKGSGAYIGAGPGLIFGGHVFRPLAITWIGYQFRSQFPKEKHLSGFIDGGITASFFKDGSKAPFRTDIYSGSLLILVPVLRGGIGFSF